MCQSYYDFVQQVAYNDNIAALGSLAAYLMTFKVADHPASEQMILNHKQAKSAPFGGRFLLNQSMG
ncbi:MAG: hypothetical protein KME47_17365 [Nodosilinea sp. WJT8-NPBG4]|jgi:hypothetical protein|nr:hypothetical protein [Nodosilinea sp. WJT8-NPBG4]